MIRLYGFPQSNYFNMVKAALLEKKLEFEVVDTRPSQEADYLEKSPMGKVPCIETPEGYLSETQTILEYLEELHPEPPLLPSETFARAKVRELLHSLELYIELPARTCYGEVFFGREVSDETKATARQVLEKGARAVSRLASFDPFVGGDSLTYADLFGVYSLPIANRVTKKLWQWDLLAGLPGAADWAQRMYAREAMQTIHEEMRAAS